MQESNMQLTDSQKKIFVFQVGSTAVSGEAKRIKRGNNPVNKQNNLQASCLVKIRQF